MTVRVKSPLIALLVLMAGIAGCASAPGRDADATAPHRFDPAADPYWLDPVWAKALLDAAQSVVQYPAPPTDMKTVGPQVTIKFTFADGAIKDPAIIAGTGDPTLDDLLLKQVSSAQVPKPAGLHTDEPHGFLLDLDMLTPFESFQRSVYSAIDRYKIYPKDAVFAGTMGQTTVDFDYIDGKANGIAIVKSSNNHVLDKASLNTVTNAIMPPVPPAYAGRNMHMEVVVCYALNDPKLCPVANNVILVFGARIRM